MCSDFYKITELKIDVSWSVYWKLECLILINYLGNKFEKLCINGCDLIHTNSDARDIFLNHFSVFLTLLIF